jgi:hypothetical protein
VHLGHAARGRSPALKKLTRWGISEQILETCSASSTPRTHLLPSACRPPMPSALVFLHALISLSLFPHLFFPGCRGSLYDADMALSSVPGTAGP